jgi:uncharacterized protein (UPF0303 family)
MVDVAPELTALIETLRDQEQRLQFGSFDLNDAWALGTLLVDTARARSLGVTVDITRGDQQVFHAALPGTTPDNDEWIARKVRTVRRFQHSSFLVGRLAELDGVDFHEVFGLSTALFVAHGGSFPIIVRGSGQVGTVTVSGLPQADDHALVVEVLEAFLGA